ncbi:MAG: potassium channel family protein [Actinomycetota bacterium]|nr:potassium channel family protein [Actinomycetota bacterium]
MADGGNDNSNYWDSNGDKIISALAVGVLALGTVVYHLIEGWSWVDAFYFSSIAVTSVGFGDFTPTSDASKLFTVFYIFSGLTLIGLWLSIRLKHRATIVAKRVKTGSVSETLQNIANPDPDTPDGG